MSYDADLDEDTTTIARGLLKLVALAEALPGCWCNCQNKATRSFERCPELDVEAVTIELCDDHVPHDWDKREALWTGGAPLSHAAALRALEAE